MHILGHFKTITKHKILVAKGCFKVGLYCQGIMHDMSKYSPTEFIPGAKYYQGNQSPNNIERRKYGISRAWLHHKGRNKHHYEYWMDYSTRPEDGICGMKMPDRYIYEMFLDRIAASKTYQKDKYTDCSPLEYYEKGNSEQFLHPYTKKVLEKLLHMLAEKGEKRTFVYLKRVIRQKKKEHRL